MDELIESIVEKLPRMNKENRITDRWVKVELAKEIITLFQPYLEAERERIARDYKDKVRTILVNHADTVSMQNETTTYYINGKSVDEFMDEIDRVELKAKYLVMVKGGQ